MLCLWVNPKQAIWWHGSEYVPPWFSAAFVLASRNGRLPFGSGKRRELLSKFLSSCIKILSSSYIVFSVLATECFYIHILV